MPALDLIETVAGRNAVASAHSSGSSIQVQDIQISATDQTVTQNTTSLSAVIATLAASGTVETVGGQPTLRISAIDESEVAYEVRALAVRLTSGVLLGVFAGPSVQVSKASGSSLVLSFDWTINADTASTVTFGDSAFLIPVASDSTPGVVQTASPEDFDAGAVGRVVTANVLRNHLRAAVAGSQSLFLTLPRVGGEGGVMQGNLGTSDTEAIACDEGGLYTAVLRRQSDGALYHAMSATRARYWFNADRRAIGSGVFGGHVMRRGAWELAITSTLWSLRAYPYDDDPVQFSPPQGFAWTLYGACESLVNGQPAMVLAARASANATVLYAFTSNAPDATVDWTVVTLPNWRELRGVASNGTITIAVGRDSSLDHGVVLRADGSSSDLSQVHWSQVATLGSDVEMRDVVWNGDRFVALGIDNFSGYSVIYTSEDGFTWTYAATFQGANLSRLTVDPQSGFVLAHGAIGQPHVISRDGLAWATARAGADVAVLAANSFVGAHYGIDPDSHSIVGIQTGTAPRAIRT